MNADQFPQQVVSLQKMYFEAWRNGINFIHATTSGVLNRMIDQATWVPKEARETLIKCDSLGVQQLKRYYSFMDEELSAYEKLLAGSGKTPLKMKPVTQPKQDA